MEKLTKYKTYLTMYYSRYEGTRVPRYRHQYLFQRRVSAAFRATIVSTLYTLLKTFTLRVIAPQSNNSNPIALHSGLLC